jgi:hypothetical protein
MLTLQLASERDALEESLGYLKNQLKKGVTMKDIGNNLRSLFEELFDNQLRINNLT